MIERSLWPTIRQTCRDLITKWGTDERNIKRIVDISELLARKACESEQTPDIITLYEKIRKDSKNADPDNIKDIYKHPMRSLLGEDNPYSGYYLSTLVGFIFQVQLIPPFFISSKAYHPIKNPSHHNEIHSNSDLLKHDMQYSLAGFIAITAGYVKILSINATFEGLLLLLATSIKFFELENESHGSDANPATRQKLEKETSDLAKAYLNTHSHTCSEPETKQVINAILYPANRFESTTIMKPQPPTSCTLVTVYGPSKSDIIKSFDKESKPDLLDLLGEAEWWWYGPIDQAEQKLPKPNDDSAPADMCWLRLDLEKRAETSSHLPMKVESYMGLRDLIEALQKQEFSVKVANHGGFNLGTAKLTESGYVRR